MAVDFLSQFSVTVDFGLYADLLLLNCYTGRRRSSIVQVIIGVGNFVFVEKNIVIITL